MSPNLRGRQGKEGLPGHINKKIKKIKNLSVSSVYHSYRSGNKELTRTSGETSGRVREGDWMPGLPT